MLYHYKISAIICLISSYLPCKNSWCLQPSMSLYLAVHSKREWHFQPSMSLYSAVHSIRETVVYGKDLWCFQPSMSLYSAVHSKRETFIYGKNSENGSLMGAEAWAPFSVMLPPLHVNPCTLHPPPAKNDVARTATRIKRFCNHPARVNCDANVRPSSTSSQKAAETAHSKAV